MSRFNSPTKTTKTTNHEGGVAYSMTAESELYSAVVATFLQDSFYEKADKRIERIKDLCTKVSPKFIAQLAYYAREEMHLRSVPVMLLVELAKLHKGDDLVRRTAGKVIQRVDEITEVLSYYQQANKRTDTKKLNKLSKQLSLGLADAFNRFDAYGFGKYNREKDVKLRDALFLVHPKPKNKAQEKVFKQIATDTLPVPYTWEAELSKVGQEKYESEKEKEEAKMRIWEELIGSGKVGFMAMLRNLRNMLEAGVPKEVLQVVAARLVNPNEIAKSKQLPFRFYSAFKELEKITARNTPFLMESLEESMSVSAKQNLEFFDGAGETAVAIDVSGSMHSSLSDKSQIQYWEIGALLAMFLKEKMPNALTYLFASEIKTYSYLYRSSMLSNVARIGNESLGGGTEGWKVLTHMMQEKISVDSLYVFTDCQLWNDGSWGRSETFGSLWKKYLKQINPKAKLYIFDLAGLGTTPVSILHPNVYFIAGWSDKIFQMLKAYEEGESAIAKIKSVEV